MVGLGWYFLAKLPGVAILDQGSYHPGPKVSGHTLKHLAAGGGASWLYRMVRLRRPLASAASA
jgi:hypothetical protein